MSPRSLQKDGAVLIEVVESAATLRGRVRGLLGREGLAAGHALHLSPCGSVHTWFMAFPLDLVFLSRRSRVVRICRNVAPWRIVRGGRHARSVIELQSGWLPPTALTPGDEVQLV